MASPSSAGHTSPEAPLSTRSAHSTRRHKFSLVLTPSQSCIDPRLVPTRTVLGHNRAHSLLRNHYEVAYYSCSDQFASYRLCFFIGVVMCPRKTEKDLSRTILLKIWLGSLRLQMNGSNTIQFLSKGELASLFMRRPENELQATKNKSSSIVRNYDSGIRFPDEESIAIGESIAPGSSAVLNHYFWSAAAPNLSMQERIAIIDTNIPASRLSPVFRGRPFWECGVGVRVFIYDSSVPGDHSDITLDDFDFLCATIYAAYQAHRIKDPKLWALRRDECMDAFCVLKRCFPAEPDEVEDLFIQLLQERFDLSMYIPETDDPASKKYVLSNLWAGREFEFPDF